MRFLPSCIPYFNFSHCISIDADEYRLGVCTVSLYFLDFELWLRVEILELEAGLADIVVPQDSDLDRRRLILFLFAFPDHCVPDIRRCQVRIGRNRFETKDCWGAVFLLLLSLLGHWGRATILVDDLSWIFVSSLVVIFLGLLTKIFTIRIIITSEDSYSEPWNGQIWLGNIDRWRGGV